VFYLAPIDPLWRSGLAVLLMAPMQRLPQNSQAFDAHVLAFVANNLPGDKLSALVHNSNSG